MFGESLQTFAAWVIWDEQELWAQEMLVPPTEGIGGGAWASPTASQRDESPETMAHWQEFRQTTGRQANSMGRNLGMQERAGHHGLGADPTEVGDAPEGRQVP